MMNLIKILYKSFIPYLIVLAGLLTFIYLLDNHAENISTEPQQIQVLAGSDELDENGHYWFYDEPNVQTTRPGLLSDSLYQLARKNYREGRENVHTTEIFTRLSEKYPYNPIPMNYLGLMAMKDMNFQQAESHFRTCLEIDSNYSGSLINLAIVSSRTHRYNEAEKLYKQARRLAPNHSNLYYNLGILYTKMEKWDLAEIQFQTCIDFSSGDRKARALCYLGKVHLQKLDTLNARKSFEQAILYKPDYELARVNYALTLTLTEEKEVELKKLYQLNPRSFNANYHLGKLYTVLSDYEKSEFHFQQALERRPYDEDIIGELGNLLMDLGRMEEARMVISGLTLKDTLPQSYFYYAKLASRQNHPDTAIQLYNEAILSSFNDYPEAHLNLAILYKQKNEYQPAIQSYLNALESRPDYARAYFNLALLYAEIDSIQQAIQYYRQSIIKDPASYKSWYNLGVIMRNNENHTEAIEAFNNSIRIQPDYLKALLALGNLYLNMDEYGRAVEMYNKLLYQYPNYSKGWFNLGLAYSRAGQTPDAIRAYEKMIEIDPDNIRSRINLGVMYVRSGDYDLAASIFEEAMDLDMTNPDIRFNLAIQYERMDLPEKARYQYDKTIELDRNYLKAYDNLIDLHTKTGDKNGLMVVHFKKMMLDPNPDSLYTIGKNMHDIGEFSHALVAYNEAKQLGMKGQWIEYWIGKVYMDQENFDLAIPQFEMALRLDPKHKFAWYRLGQTFELLDQAEKAEDYYASLTNLDPGFRILHKSPLKTN